MKSFGFSGLKNYFELIIDKFSEVYSSCQNGFANKQVKHQIYPPHNDKKMVEVILKISQNWKSLLTQMMSILRLNKCELVSEKQILLEKDIIRSYKTDTYNTLICVENPQVAYFVAQNVKNN